MSERTDAKLAEVRAAVGELRVELDGIAADVRGRTIEKIDDLSDRLDELEATLAE
jgi:peptidoglycan hydrolase CwlO-like protein